MMSSEESDEENDSIAITLAGTLNHQNLDVLIEEDKSSQALHQKKQRINELKNKLRHGILHMRAQSDAVVDAAAMPCSNGFIIHDSESSGASMVSTSCSTSREEPQSTLRARKHPTVWQ